MIKIRYRDPSELSPGLHAAAERHGRNIVVYLLSGLTAPQRRAALRRLRQSARMGYCPELPAAQLGLALAIDWVRTGLGRAGAVFRLHPAGSTVPVMMASGAAIAFLVLSTVSIRVLHSPRLPGHPPPLGYPSPTASARADPVAASSPNQAPVARQPASDTGQVTSARPAPGRPSSGPARPGPGTGGGTGSPGSGGPPPSVTGTAAAAPGPPSTSPPARPGRPTPSPTDPTGVSGSPSAFPTGDSGDGVCLHMGPLGVCLSG
jgi:hypothetical protein